MRTLPGKAARHDIFGEWALATDPANLQPKVRPALKAAADQLRKYPRPGLNQDEINAIIESIEVPGGARIENKSAKLPNQGTVLRTQKLL